MDERHEAQKAILSQGLPALQPHHSRKADFGTVLRHDASVWTKAWQLGAISNLEYLMRVNSLAGRTYSDLTQAFYSTSYSLMLLSKASAAAYGD